MEEWLQAVIRLPSTASEAASAALFEAGCRSVWEDLPDSKGRAVLRAAFGTDDAMRLMTELPQAAERIAEAFGLGSGEVGIELEVKLLEDWDAAWRKDQLPIRVTPRLAVCPSFWKGDPFDPPREGERPTEVVRMSPGAAFGSGRHPTTFLCLKILSDLSEAEEAAPEGPAAASAAPDGEAGGEASSPKGGPAADGYASAALSPFPSRKRILDLGSGSGILAIACAMLFPDSEVLGLDTDADTTGTARKNAEANNVLRRAEFRSGTLDGSFGGFDVIAANITLNPLLGLAGEITRAARPGARLALSGLLADQAEECARAYQRQGWHWLRHLGQAEWSALEMAFPGGAGDEGDGAEGGPDPARDIVSEPSLETPPPEIMLPAGPDGGSERP
ncbi:MAG: 50S ribosomal protein L11 methyltransferase [Deltaproteobacteria bacterium]|jgi:ribosomal protein L11 methyltransferase|nr:50S ribosomal protein L11 methyltransferase [Deltaproteobacteria bacterium]